MLLICRFIASVVIGLLLPLFASAQTVTFQAHSAHATGSEGPFVSGGIFVWTVSMDLSAPLVSSSGTSANGWARYDAITSITLNFNEGEYAASHTFATPASVLVQNHSSGDIFSINYFGSAVPTSWPLVNGKQLLLSPQILTFSTAAGNALTSWDLVSPVGLDWFDTGADATDIFAFTLTGAGGASGNIISLTTGAIPEPSTYAALAGLGALGLAFWRRRRAVSAACPSASSNLP